MAKKIEGNKETISPKAAKVRHPTVKVSIAAKADEGILSDETKAQLREKAKERVLELRRQEAEDKFLEAAEYEERVKQGVAGGQIKTDLVKVYIDLPEYATSLNIDRQVFFQGAHYTVQHHVYDSLVDNMARAWEHQSEIEGKPRRHYNKKKGMVVQGGSGQVLENDPRAVE